MDDAGMTALTKPRVLLADDYAPLITALRRLLANDFEVLGQATTAAELFHLVEINRPDIVILDLHLPDADGITVCRRLRLIEPALKVIMMTALEDADVREAALEAGASDFVPKSQLHAQLLPAILRVCAPPSEAA
jgi:DNA-binding NarL/FixJ family response regulator